MSDFPVSKHVNVSLAITSPSLGVSSWQDAECWHSLPVATPALRCQLGKEIPQLIHAAQQWEALEMGMELMEKQRAEHKPVWDHPGPIRPTRLGTRVSTKEHKAQQSSFTGISNQVRAFFDIFHFSSKASSSAALCWWVKCTIKKFSSHFLSTKQIPHCSSLLPQLFLFMILVQCWNTLNLHTKFYFPPFSRNFIALIKPTQQWNKYMPQPFQREKYNSLVYLKLGLRGSSM